MSQQIGREEMETDDFEGDKGKEENAEDEMPADDDQLCGDKDKSDQQAMADEEDTEQKDESEKHRDGEMPNVSAPKAGSITLMYQGTPIS